MAKAKAKGGHAHAHGKGHAHSHSLAVYEFFSKLVVSPLDETLRFNVLDKKFWRSQFLNRSTAVALQHIDDALDKLGAVSEEERPAALESEYRQMFEGDAPCMPPRESDYGRDQADSQVKAFARSTGLLENLSEDLPYDHLASELMLCASAEHGHGVKLSARQTAQLAVFFQGHPIALAEDMLARFAREKDETSGFYRAVVELIAAWLKWDLSGYGK